MPRDDAPCRAELAIAASPSMTNAPLAASTLALALALALTLTLNLTQICSEVLPFMFVSGDKVATDEACLRNSGITHVVNCAAGLVPNLFVKGQAGTTGGGGGSGGGGGVEGPLECDYLSLFMHDSKDIEDVTW